MKKGAPEIIDNILDNIKAAFGLLSHADELLDLVSPNNIKKVGDEDYEGEENENE